MLMWIFVFSPAIGSTSFVGVAILELIRALVSSVYFWSFCKANPIPIEIF
ncbi:hypothetical protein OsJ_17246 [Oryza sativa Japonica Group]|uniref:Uncharacterized protein n=1 Tax=Oryza sativa subsp. japonica TaxID=39947 RepID=B9FMM9_ORYSJ|nr:hypothetical protein OsJ_17246 [Oryza sativa Japonica Group]